MKQSMRHVTAIVLVAHDIIAQAQRLPVDVLRHQLVPQRLQRARPVEHAQNRLAASSFGISVLSICFVQALQTLNL